MTCQEFWTGMPELERGLDDAGSVHLSECPACAVLYRQQGQIAEGLRSVAQQWSRVGAPSRVESRLTAAFRAQNGLGAADRRSFWRPVLSWAVAAAVIAALALFLLSSRQPQPASNRAPRRIELAVVESPYSGDSVAALYRDAGFIPLPNAPEVTSGDDVNLVRLELPRSAMIAAGYTVSADRASEPVEAEVVLGPDGIARAVRFLDN